MMLLIPVNQEQSTDTIFSIRKVVGDVMGLRGILPLKFVRSARRGDCGERAWWVKCREIII